jgi:excisionase family DNA binding protein
VRRGPLNPRRAKLHWSYTVAEAAKLFGVCRNTVRNWIANGLPVVKTSSGHLILGRELRAFLERERAKRKRKCPRGFLFCVGCRRADSGRSGHADDRQHASIVRGVRVAHAPARLTLEAF